LDVMYPAPRNGHQTTTHGRGAATAVGFWPRTMSSIVQTSSVAAGASIVVVNASAAIPFAATALPGVKAEPSEPEQPGAQQCEGHVVGNNPELG